MWALMQREHQVRSFLIFHLPLQYQEREDISSSINPTNTMMRMRKNATKTEQIGMCQWTLNFQKELYIEWTAWLLGYPLNRSKKSNGEVYLATVKPLHLLRYGNLPAKTKKKFDNHWRPILELMHGEVDAVITSTPVEKRNDRFISS